MQALDGYSEVKTVFFLDGELMGRLDGKVVRDHGRRRRHRAARRRVLFSGEGATVCVADVSAESRRAGRCRVPRRVLPRCRRHRRRQRPGAVRRTSLQRCGGIDVLYNNAGIMPADDDSILDDRARRLGPRAGRQRAWRLPLLQARHPAPARARRRLRHQRRLVRRARRRGHLADLVHRIKGRRALDEPRARCRVRPSGSARERALPGPVETPLLHAALRRDARGVRAPARPPADGPARAGAGDRRTARSSSRATSRPT